MQLKKENWYFLLLIKKIKIKSGIHWNQEELMVCSLTIKKNALQKITTHADIVAHN